MNLEEIDLDEALAGLTPENRKAATLVLEELDKRTRSTTVYGFVDPVKGFTHALRLVGNEWVQVQDEPDVYLAAKMEKVLTTTARHIFLIGGRGSSKSIGAGDICLGDARDNGAKTFCLREYQTSIADSVHALLVEEIERLEFLEDGFSHTQNTITKDGAAVFRFAGLSRNPAGIKSAFGFRTWLVEEAHFLSEDSLDILMPSVRKKPNKGLPKSLEEIQEELAQALDKVRIIFIANLMSLEDPFTKRILPFLPEVEQHGYYEDELRLIVKLNYDDNPWFLESGMEDERAEAERTLPVALYNHIWKGETNDSVENALVLAEWFDACVDAHTKMGWIPRGVKAAGHDPSDIGKDPKGYAMRHGSVFLRVEENREGNVNEGGHWACKLALEDGVDYYTWDNNGVGAGLSEQTAADLRGKKIDIVGFMAQGGVDDPEKVYNAAAPEDQVKGQLKNKDVFKNLRAQYAFELRDRIYRTYLAVTKPQEYGYQDPDTLISFSSTMPMLSKLRAEVCRMPRKKNRNGLQELYTKEEMKKPPYKLPSPNLFDSVCMSLRYEPPAKPHRYHIPAPIKPINTSGRPR